MGLLHRGSYVIPHPPTPLVPLRAQSDGTNVHDGTLTFSYNPLKKQYFGLVYMSHVFVSVPPLH